MVEAEKEGGWVRDGRYIGKFGSNGLFENLQRAAKHHMGLKTYGAAESGDLFVGHPLYIVNRHSMGSRDSDDHLSSQ